MISNKKLNQTVTELFIRGRQKNHSSVIDFRSFMNLYKKCTAKRYSFFLIDNTLAQVIIYISVRTFLKEYKTES